LVGKAVLACSGGLDTSVIIKYFQQKYDTQVVTVTVDVGQRDDLKAIGEKAKRLEVLTSQKRRSKARERSLSTSQDETCKR